MGLTSHEGGAVTALQAYPAVTAPNRATLVFLCGEGGFTKRTLERSECASVRNATRSKHYYKNRFEQLQAPVYNRMDPPRYTRGMTPNRVHPTFHTPHYIPGVLGGRAT